MLCCDGTAVELRLHEDGAITAEDCAITTEDGAITTENAKKQELIHEWRNTMQYTTVGR
jgi:hypothetical protein